MTATALQEARFWRGLARRCALHSHRLTPEEAAVVQRFATRRHPRSAVPTGEKRALLERAYDHLFGGAHGR